MLDICEEDTRKRTVVADAEALPLKKQNFHAVFCRGVLHHVPSPESAIAEIYSILKPGGYFIVSEPCNDSFIVRIIRKIMYKRSWKFEEDEHPFLTQELSNRLSNAGFIIRARKYHGYLAYSILGFTDILPPH
jgi:ubiquinone/menaquinone biosynthesis C-methylase UbiE